MKMQTRLVKQEDRAVRIATLRVSRESDVECEEPAQTPAALVEIDLNVVESIRVRNERVQVRPVDLKAHL